jgi:hypothetical protein
MPQVSVTTLFFVTVALKPTHKTIGKKMRNTIYSCALRMSTSALILSVLTACGPQSEMLADTSASVVSLSVNIDDTPRLIGAGWYHACGLTESGTASCWGRDDYGQVSGANQTPMTEIGVGAFHNCGLSASKTAVCWGRNNRNQIDAPATPFEQLAVGSYHNCGLTAAGSIECWGWDGSNQSTPPTDTGYAAVAAGRYNACALKSDGQASCWGSNNYGQSAAPSNIPFAQVSLGAFHGCGLTITGSVNCWGYSGYGLTQVPAGNDFVEVRAGDYHSCGRHADGQVECWGADWYGQASAPTGQLFAQIAAGYTFSCGLQDTGNVQCWGSNSHGQTAVPTGITFAAPLAGDTCADAIALEVTEGQQTIAGNTTNAANDYATPCTYSNAPDQVYAFTLDQVTEIDAMVSGYDTALYLRSSCEDASSGIACNDDSTPPGAFGSRIAQELQPGTYFLFVDGYASSKGQYTLDVTFTPVQAPVTADLALTSVTRDLTGYTAVVCNTGVGSVPVDFMVKWDDGTGGPDVSVPPQGAWGTDLAQGACIDLVTQGCAGVGDGTCTDTVSISAEIETQTPLNETNTNNNVMTVSFNGTPSERDALIALYNATNGTGWTNNTGWVTGVADPTSDHCTWFGVTCVNGLVTEISLGNQNLSGNIPPQLGNLANLWMLDIANNQLTGVISEALGSFIASMQTYDLVGNQFSCPYPTALAAYFSANAVPCL